MLHVLKIYKFRSPGRREVYDAARPGYRGRCTAPLLIDKQRK